MNNPSVPWFYPASGSTTSDRPIFNVGWPLLPDKAESSAQWRKGWRDAVMPALIDFNPDIIFLSAGFDAHRRDTVNHGYVGLVETDYEWLTEQVVRVANTCCEGRLVSILEGGYRIHGYAASPLAQSIKSHVAAMSVPHGNTWTQEYVEREKEFEVRVEEERQRLVAEAEAEFERQAAEHRRRVQAAQEAAKAAVASGGHFQIPLKSDAGAAAAAAAPTPADSGAVVSRSRRKRKVVDYVALDAMMREAEKQQFFVTTMYLDFFFPGNFEDPDKFLIWSHQRKKNWK